MKTCKKLLAITIALVLLVSTLVSGLVVSAADATTTLAIGTTTIKEGTTTADVEFVLTFAAPTKTPHSLCTITAADGLTLTAIKVDQAKTKYVKKGEDGQWVDDELITDEEAKVTIDNDGKNLAAGKVLVESAADSKAPTVTYITFVATFAVAEGLKEGTYAVSAEADATNWDEDDIAVTVKPGAVVVEAAHVCEAGKPVDNGDGTHDVPCTGCDVLIKDNEAHNFVDGACDVCGAKEPVTGPIITSAINVKSKNVAFENGFDFKVAIPSAELDKYDSFYVEFVKDVYTGTEVTSERSSISTEYVKNGSYYVFVFNGIAAKELKDKITVKVYAEKEDISYCSEDFYYSISEYLYDRLEKSTDTNLKALCANLLVYGAEAQKYFGYNTDNLASKEMTDTHKAMVVLEPEIRNRDVVVPMEGEKVTFPRLNASFNNTVDLMFALTVNSTVKPADFYVEVEYGEGKVKRFEGTDLEVNGSYLVVRFKEFVAKEMRNQATAKAYLNDGTPISGSRTISIEDYAYAQRNSTTKNLKTLVRAVLAYGDATAYYFANK